MRVEIRKSTSKNPLNRYYYAIVGSNNEDMNTSETYFSKSNCKRAANDMAKLIHCEVVDTTVKPYTKHGGFA